MSQKPDQTYYEILEVSPEAPEHEIHRAYKQAKQTYSPDSPALYTMFTTEEAKALILLIEEAYSVLGNYSTRRAYDAQLLGRGETSVSEVSTPITAPPMAAQISHEVNEVKEEEIKNCDVFTGEVLADIRDYKNFTIEALSNKLRISKTYIRAIETNDFSALPANVFIRGFIVQYAKALNLDHEKVANSYMKLVKDARG